MFDEFISNFNTKLNISGPTDFSCLNKENSSKEKYVYHCVFFYLSSVVFVLACLNLHHSPWKRRTVNGRNWECGVMI